MLPSLGEAIELAQLGHTSQSLLLLQSLHQQHPHSFPVCLNLGVLHLRQHQLKQAQHYFTTAIRINKYSYLGYYNMLVLKCMQVDTLPKGSRFRGDGDALAQHKKQALKYLYFTLSCLCYQLGMTLNNEKLLSKCLSYCEEHSMAYAARGLLRSHSGKLALAENDYTSSIYYDINNPDLYMGRAEFYWRSGRLHEAEQDMQAYYKLKKEEMGEGVRGNELIGGAIEEGEVEGYEHILREKMREIREVLDRLREASNGTETVEGDRAIKDSAQMTSERVHIELAQQEASNNELQDSGADPVVEDSRQQGSKGDESSKNISQQIEKLENQIKKQRGNVFQKLLQPQPVLVEENLLTEEIEKTSQQIQSLKHTPVSSQQSLSLSQQLQNQLGGSSGSVLSPRSSTASVYSQKVVTAQQLLNYTTIQLEVVNAQFFSTQGQTRVLLSYGTQSKETQYRHDHIWHNKVQFGIEPHLHTHTQAGDEDEGEGEEEPGEVRVEVEARAAKMFWSSRKSVGRGTLRVLQTGTIKCFVSHEGVNTGVVYFKLKLT